MEFEKWISIRIKTTHALRFNFINIYNYYSSIDRCILFRIRDEYITSYDGIFNIHKITMTCLQICDYFCSRLFGKFLNCLEVWCFFIIFLSINYSFHGVGYKGFLYSLSIQSVITSTIQGWSFSVIMFIR